MGFAQNLANVSVEAIDGYAGLAFMGGSQIDGGEVVDPGVEPRPAVIFPNTVIGDAVSYIVGYVDEEAHELRMVEVSSYVYMLLFQLLLSSIIIVSLCMFFFTDAHVRSRQSSEVMRTKSKTLPQHPCRRRQVKYRAILE